MKNWGSVEVDRLIVLVAPQVEFCCKYPPFNELNDYLMFYCIGAYVAVF